MAARMPGRSPAAAPVSNARMLAANVVPCAVPATALATRNGATAPAQRSPHTRRASDGFAAGGDERGAHGDRADAEEVDERAGRGPVLGERAGVESGMGL